MKNIIIIKIKIEKNKFKNFYKYKNQIFKGIY